MTFRPCGLVPTYDNPATIRKLDLLVKAYPDAYRCVREDAAYLAKRYTAPAALIRFGKPASAAKMAAGRERVEALRRG